MLRLLLLLLLLVLLIKLIVIVLVVFQGRGNNVDHLVSLLDNLGREIGCDLVGEVTNIRPHSVRVGNVK